MYFELFNDKYVLFIDKYGFDDNILYKEENLEIFLKNIFLIIYNKYNFILNGIYQLDIYNNSKLGLYIEIYNIDEYLFCDEINLKINIINNAEFYYVTEYFDIISNYNDIYYYNDKYYINVDMLDNLNKFVEFGDFLLKSNICFELLSKIK